VKHLAADVGNPETVAISPTAYQQVFLNRSRTLSHRLSGMAQWHSKGSCYLFQIAVPIDTWS
jgi:hypothetical protein